MKIAFIHNEKKISTGAHYINDLISIKLKKKGIIVKHFYPTQNLYETTASLKGIANILFFFSLLEHRDEILKCDLVQGTTYTPITFLPYDIPVISHFGSTTKGFLNTIPQTKNIEKGLKEFWYHLKDEKVLDQVNLKTRKPLRDIAEIELMVASRASAVIATSNHVQNELSSFGVMPEKIHTIHNAIEDFWFEKPIKSTLGKPALIFLGRLGNDSFNLKLKGLDRLFDWYSRFEKQDKLTLGITTNEGIGEYFAKNIPRHTLLANIKKDQIPQFLHNKRGSIMFITSRYEGFSLSLIEGMSQGIIPISYRVGVAPEIIQQGVNGFLVDTQEEAEKFTRMLLKDSRLRKKISEAAYMTARQFTAENMINKFIALYEKVIKESPNKNNKFSSGFKRFFR
jgi:glycosyltransferase involved in cell wall biosynthesis